METKNEKVKNLKLNPANPRTIKDDKFHKLVKSIRDFPQMLKIRPIVVNDKMEVLGGNMRLRACIEAGLKEVPIIQASELTEDQQREFIVKDNVGFGEWDMEALANKWDADELSEWGLDLPVFSEMQEPDELIGEAKNKDATLKITFPTPEDLQKCEAEIQEVINRLCPKAFYSVSAGEV